MVASKRAFHIFVVHPQKVVIEYDFLSLLRKHKSAKFLLYAAILISLLDTMRIILFAHNGLIGKGMQIRILFTVYAIPIEYEALQMDIYIQLQLQVFPSHGSPVAGLVSHSLTYTF